jgi:hypothetical protein
MAGSKRLWRSREMVTIAGRTDPAVDCADAPLKEVEQLVEPTCGG